MRKLQLGLLCVGLATALTATTAQAKSNFGFNYGYGLPYVQQIVLNYSTPKFGIDVSYNQFAIDSGDASVTLTKPEVAAKWHAFSGAFFLGVGLGQQTLKAEAEDTGTGLKATGTVTSLTVTPSLGWLWGRADGGFIFGLDFGMQIPMGAETKVESDLPSTNEAYEDAKKAGDAFGAASLPVFTLFRIGYLF